VIPLTSKIGVGKVAGIGAVTSFVTLVKISGDIEAENLVALGGV
jgi:hypothetical protein